MNRYQRSNWSYLNRSRSNEIEFKYIQQAKPSRNANAVQFDLSYPGLDLVAYSFDNLQKQKKYQMNG